MAKYRKKPIVIEATQWFQNGDHPDDCCSTIKTGAGLKNLGEGQVVRRYRIPEYDGQDKCKQCGEIMHEHGWIDTLEGGHIVCPSDWIITDVRAPKGQHGYYYPCKPDIFKATYEEEA